MLLQSRLVACVGALDNLTREWSMSKQKIPADRGPKNDWHAMMKFAGDGMLFPGGLSVEHVGDGVVIIAPRETKTIVCAGGMGLVGAALAACGGVSVLGVAFIAIGLGLLGGGALLFRSRLGIRMSPGGELVLVCGLRKKFHLDPQELIPRLSAVPDADADACLKLYNINLRQVVEVIKNEKHHADEIRQVLASMIGADSIDSTFMEVKLAGMSDDWIDVEPPSLDADQPDAETLETDEKPKTGGSRAPMRAGGFIFSGARLSFPRRGEAVVQLPTLKRIGLPVAICLGLWIVAILLLNVVGVVVGLESQTAMLIGEIGLTAIILGVGLVFRHRGAPIMINRKKRTISGPRRRKCGFTGGEMSIRDVTAVQSCRHAAPGSDETTDECSYELNLAMKDLSRRLHLITDSDADRVRESAEELASFLRVPHWDCT